MEENNIAPYPVDVSDIAVVYGKTYKAYGAICPCCGSFFESPHRPIMETNWGVVTRMCQNCAQMIEQSEYKGKTYGEVLNEMQQECAKRDLCFVGRPEFTGCMIRQLKKWKEDENGRTD